MGKTILAFEIKKEKKTPLEHLCADQGITIQHISPKAYNLQLSHITKGIAPAESQEKEAPFPMEMIVFSEFSKADLDSFLEEYRARGIEPIPLKAMTTPDNMKWTAKELFKELMQEHIFFTRKK